MLTRQGAMATLPAYTTFPETPDALLAACRADMDLCKGLLSRLLSVSGERDAHNTLETYNELIMRLGNAGNRAGLLSEVHPEPAMRTAAETATQEVSAFATDLALHRGLYDALSAVPSSPLDPLSQRWLRNTLRDFRRAGVDKDEPTRDRIKVLAEEMVKLGQSFDRNIREDVRSVKLRPEQLRGLPEDYIAGHPPGPDGMVTVTTDYPDYLPFRQYAEDASAREALYRVNANRAFPVNEPLFLALLRARREQATLLGYRDWADYVTEDKMIGSGENIRRFVDKVADVAAQRAKADHQILLERKKKDHPEATRVEGWEAGFYEEKVRREQFAFDSQTVRPYFEFAPTQQGLLAITSELYGIRYEPVPDARTWHPSVQVFDVFEGEQSIGRIYLDLHPRPDKYKHAAQFPIVNGVAGRQLPEGALVCNFPDPRVSSPALMDHDGVVTLFHEFGHLMHHLLAGKARWVSQSGVATEWDFVEAPSQMFEEWAWDPSTLGRFARHITTHAPIPAELVARMRRADNFGQGTHARSQTFYAELSRRYHTEDPSSLDLLATLKETQGRYSMFPYLEGTHFNASFGHLNGYSAMYYTYLWSLVIAKDLLSEFRKDGLLNVATARRYRDAILVPGGTQDAAQMVTNFLGRPYNFDAFEQWLNQA